MPRDGSGNYSLPAGNPFVTGTTISSSTMNSTLTDVATALTGSLSRSGSGGMLVAFQNLSGTVASPGITWSSDTASGFFLNAAGDMRVSIGGGLIGKWTSSGYANTGTLTTSGALTVSAGGTTITAGGLTVSAGGANITGGLTVDGQSIAFAVPSVTGQTGKFLTNNGSSPNWGAVPSGYVTQAMLANYNGATAAVNVAGLSSATLADITGASVSMTFGGNRPVAIGLRGAASDAGTNGMRPTFSGASTSAIVWIAFLVNGTNVAEFTVTPYVATGAGVFVSLAPLPSCIINQAAGGPYTVKAQYRMSGTNFTSVDFNNLVFYCYEL